MESFSKALQLNGANATTSYILWSMIVFLLALITGLVFAGIKQYKKLHSNVSSKKSTTQKKEKKGF